MSVRTASTGPEEQRRAIMALCAEARPGELHAALEAVGYRGGTRTLRPAETGLVMARARIGGDGSPFNLGEATVTRAAVRIASGEAGFAWHLGRDAARAEAAALLDALWQVAALRSSVEAALAPVRQRLEAEAELQARQTAATRVEFFTMVRGEG
jgi:alpha-D-ribose 1-methylphosphonate 5-triphosphate synthase subunit PhnG